MKFREEYKEKIDSVHERDLQVLLKKIGILDDFNNEKIKCKFCGDIVYKDNIHSILPQSGTFHLVCSKPECVMKMTEHLNQRRDGLE